MATKDTTKKASKTNAKAQEAEANEEVRSFEYKGETYEVPSAFDLPWEILEAVQDQDAPAILKGVLGDEQSARWLAGKPTIREGMEFLEKALEAAGFDELGN